MLDGSQTNYYQGLIGVLRWIAELECIDIIVPVSLLSHYRVSPREGPLQQVYHIFAYLKQFNQSMIGFDGSEPNYSDTSFHKCELPSHNPDVSEQIPKNMSKRRSCRMLGNPTIAYRSHCICEPSAHCVVFKAPKYSGIVDVWIRIRHPENRNRFDWCFTLQLCMFGIALCGPTHICPPIIICDNEAGVLNTTHPESTSKR